MLDIEAVHLVVCTRSWLVLQLFQSLLVNNTALSFGLEDPGMRLWVLFNNLWVVLPNSWRLLLKVDVYSDRLHIVQRVVLVERQGEIAFVVHPRGHLMPLHFFGLILARPNIDFRVTLKHLARGNKPLLLTIEGLDDFSPIKVL